MTPLAASRMDGIGSPVTLDWSALAGALQTHTNTPLSLIEWVASSPSKRGVHVVLGGATTQAAVAPSVRRQQERKLRNALLSMGCTVTARVKFA